MVTARFTAFQLTHFTGPVIQLSRNETFNKPTANLSVNNLNTDPVKVYGFQ
jgi:hypothetical protein